MKNINELLAGIGVEIPEDKKEEFNKAFNENYKTSAEFDKKVARLETERDGFKEQLATANESLKAFEGIDANDFQKQLEEANKRAKDAEDNYNNKLAERDFEDALKAEMGNYKFSSKAAENAIYARVKDAGLKCVDGKILGLSDFMENCKASDAGAFVQDEPNTPSARFTNPMGAAGSEHKLTREEIMNIKNASERQAAIEANIDLFR